MDLYEQASKLSKEIQKLTIVLNDSTALTQAQHTAKENKWAVLIAQLQGLQSQLQPVIITKVEFKD